MSADGNFIPRELFPNWNKAYVVLRVPLSREYEGQTERVWETSVTIKQLTALIAEHLELTAFGREDSVSIRVDMHAEDYLPHTIFEEAEEDEHERR